MGVDLSEGVVVDAIEVIEEFLGVHGVARAEADLVEDQLVTEPLVAGGLDGTPGFALENEAG